MAPQEARPARRRRPPPWLLALLLVLAALSVLLRVEASRRGKDIQKLRTEYASLVQARPIAETKARRARFYMTRYFRGYPWLVSHNAADFIRRLGGIFRPRQILDLQIDPGMHDFRFQLTVGIGGGDAGAALWRFAGLYETLRGFPDITQLSFAEKGPAYSGPGNIFVISGRADLQ